MSTVTEILLVTALLVSDTPVTDIVPVVHETGTATSSMIAAPAITETSSGAAVSTVVPEDLVVAFTTGAAVSSTIVDMRGYGTLLSTGSATSTATVSQAYSVLVTAEMTSTTTPDNTLVLVASGAAVSTMPVTSTTQVVTLVTAGGATSAAIPGRLEVVTEAGVAVSTVTAVNVATTTLTSTGAAASSLPVAAGDVDPDILASTATGTTSVLMQLDATSTLASTADGTSTARFKNPGAVAWVLNTETTGTSTYDNFDFESVAQTPDKILAVGPDGLYELTGDTDSGDTIDARIVSGFTDFKLDQIKRVDAMYFGYTSVGGLALKVETLDSGHAPTSYALEARQATAPRSTRVVVGKGMYGRYWRVTLSNIAGADFEIHDATVDIAVSTRRV